MICIHICNYLRIYLARILSGVVYSILSTRFQTIICLVYHKFGYQDQILPTAALGFRH